MSLMIRSFRSKDTEALFRLERVKRWVSIERQALRKLVQLDIAKALSDMRTPPGNRLEALSGNRTGQWSIRINDQYRLCFRWTEEGPEDVEIVDYH
jgi:toxin HigB-1